MTTIAYKGWVLAADSRETISADGGGDLVVNPACRKLFHIGNAVLATAGDSMAGLVFLDWYRRGARKNRRPVFDSGDVFDVIVMARKTLVRYDRSCLAEALDPESQYAWGSGAKAALGAMYAQADAVLAVHIACQIDPWSGLPVRAYRVSADGIVARAT